MIMGKNWWRIGFGCQRNYVNFVEIMWCGGMDMFLFLPPALDVNRHNFTKHDFYKSLKSYIRLSSPSYRLKLEVMGRMFAQNPDLYADIATQNLSAPKFTNLFKQATDQLERVVANRDREALIESFESTKDYLTANFCEAK